METLPPDSYMDSAMMYRLSYSVWAIDWGYSIHSSQNSVCCLLVHGLAMHRSTLTNWNRHCHQSKLDLTILHLRERGRGGRKTNKKGVELHNVWPDSNIAQDFRLVILHSNRVDWKNYRVRLVRFVWTTNSDGLSFFVVVLIAGILVTAHGWEAGTWNLLKLVELDYIDLQLMIWIIVRQSPFEL